VSPADTFLTYEVETVRKSFITPGGQDAATPEDAWLDLDQLARVEVTSEDPRYPIEAAFVPGRTPGWRAGGRGRQTVRLQFDEPQRIRRIWLHFAERAAARTQEFVLRWGTADGQPTREVVRQQWIFHPNGSTHETEDYRVDLSGVVVLELTISPDISGADARASLAELRLA
jgi:hypothetical protein